MATNLFESRLNFVSGPEKSLYTIHMDAELDRVGLPQKRFYRQRAHSNPIADHTFD